MIHSRADRCIDLNDHGQLRGRVTLGKEEAAGWPWSSPSPRATTSATSGRPRARPAPSTPPAAITSTPRRPGNRPAGGGDPEHKHSASPPGRSSSAEPYDAVYQQRDPRTGDKLGRPRGRYATFADHLARLKAAEPHATAERVIELEREAAQATRQPAAYTDVTVSFSKSISVLHASIRENARRARLAGDEPRAGVLVRAGGEVPGDLAPGQPGRAGVPAGMGRGHPDRLSRCPGGRAGAGPVRGSGPGRDVVAAGHQPGRRPAGSHSQSDRADHPHRPRREVAGAGHREPARGPRRAAGVSPRRRWSAS